MASHAPARPAAWSALRTTVVSELLAAALPSLGTGPLRIVDAGGGTGGVSVPLAALGHDVTVVDPSPDALAALDRRAREAGLPPGAQVRAVQGDLATLARLLPADAADLVLVHHVLDVVEDRAAALAGVAAVVRRGGLVSVLVANRTAAVLSRVLTGRFAEAHALLAAGSPAGSPPDGAADHPAGDRAGGAGGATALAPHGPLVLAELRRLLLAAGLQPEQEHGVRVFTDLVPGALLDADPGSTAALVDLERAAASRAEFLPIAGQLHVLARRG